MILPQYHFPLFFLSVILLCTRDTYIPAIDHEYMDGDISGTFCTNMPMRTFRWEPGSSDSTLNTSMIAVSAVERHRVRPFSPLLSILFYPLPESVVGVCQHVMSVRLPNCISSWPFAYSIRDSGSVWGLFWGKQVAWSSWWSTSASRCALAVGGMCLSTLFVLAILVVCHDMRHLTFP